MRLNFTLIVLSVLVLPLSAQITITEASFPEVGDTLLTYTDNLPSSLGLYPEAGEHSWNFTTLQAPAANMVVVEDASTGSAFDAFPSASLRYSSLDNVGETYYRILNGELQRLGNSSNDQINLGLELSTAYDPPYVERTAPLDYLDAKQTSSALIYAFDPADLPVNLFEGLPITPDSIRVRVTFDSYNLVNAYGTLTIPGGIYDVLREKRTETVNTRLDALVGFIGWQDITDIVVAAIDNEEITQLIGEVTTTSHYFWSNEAKEPIAIVTVNEDETEATQVVYKANTVVSTRNIIKDKPNIYAYPNPTIVNVKFHFSNLDNGNYTLRIYNLIGKELWNKNYYVNRREFVQKEDVSFLAKGAYLYSLSDSKGRTISTKRLIIIRP